MTETRLIPISAEDVERLRRLDLALNGKPPFNWTPTTRDAELARSLVSRYESGIDEDEAHELAQAADEGSAGGFSATDKLRSAFTQEQDR